MRSRHDIIVIGAGAGGLGVAIGMARFGFAVLLIDRDESNFGGECLNSGCIPSKALIHVAGIIQNASLASSFGLKVDGQVDMAAVKRYLDESMDTIRQHESAEYLQREEGIDVLIGEASFSSPKSVTVNGAEYRASKFLIATGSSPRIPDIPGIDKPTILTNENLFSLEEIPERMVIIGAGPIGLEMGQAFGRLGSKVTVLDQSDRIANGELPEVSELLQQRLEEEGMDFRLNSRIVRFGSSNELVYVHSNGTEHSLTFDKVLVAIGREVSYDSLKLENAGIKLRNGRLILDSYLRTTNRRVLAAGDAVGNAFFSHAAELHTTVILTNFFTPWPFRKRYSLDHFSRVTFTNPEVASFGLGEDQIRKSGRPYDKLDYRFDEDDRATVSDYRYGRLILFLSKNRLNPRNGKILGGTIVAPQAGEMIQELILARQKGLGLSSIFNKIYPYPTQSRVTKIALVAKFSDTISPGIKRLLKALFQMWG